MKHETIVLKLLPLYVHFPTRDSLKEAMKGFKGKYDVPQALVQSMDLIYQLLHLLSTPTTTIV